MTGSNCPIFEAGTNLRNNYQYMFGIDNIGSTGTDLCSPYYRGPLSFSEKESYAFSQYLQHLSMSSPNMNLAINLDSHSSINGVMYSNNYVNDPYNLYFQNNDLSAYIYFSSLN